MKMPTIVGSSINYQQKKIHVQLSIKHFIIHYENMPIQIYWKFYNQKEKKKSDKNSDIFHISAQKLDCGYSVRRF